MKHEEICVGDVFLISLGSIQGLKGVGADRPVRVKKKYKHYILCETITMTNSMGLPTKPYNVCYMAQDLTRRLDEKEVKKWREKSTVDLIIY